ncbi:MAG: FAD-dependent oxidoreductase [Oscillospiraceae bacterium]|nr:FAD-dependent oxidoreductase [Oscillospiraceae bacterium]
MKTSNTTPTSLWHSSVSHTPCPSLTGEVTTDALVIGGGMCGVLTAHMLKESGVDCLLVEGGTVGRGTSGNTTAKITAQHGLLYSALMKRRGVEVAQQHYAASMDAVETFATLSQQHPCDFERKTAYIYSRASLGKLEEEAEAYSRLGISSDIATPSLPFSTAGAVAMENQAQFNPLMLLYGLAKELQIYENTLVQRINGNVAYTSGGKITAKKIVLATHFPMVNIPGLYFLKLYQHRSYVAAVRDTAPVDGMYLDHQSGGLSFRTYGDLLLVGGGGHKTGQKGGGFAELRNFVERTYPTAKIEYSWAAQDTMSLDGLPYIGRHSMGKSHLYVACGFGKWGMTGSMLAAQSLRDMIVHGNEKRNIYRPNRSIFTSQLPKNIGSAVVGLASVGGPRCTHMGCKLKYNAAEKSWDCPCHGSRYGCSGEVLNNPAKRGRTF